MRYTSDGRRVPSVWEEGIEVQNRAGAFCPAMVTAIDEKRMRVAVDVPPDGELWDLPIESDDWRWQEGTTEKSAIARLHDRCRRHPGVGIPARTVYHCSGAVTSKWHADNSDDRYVTAESSVESRDDVLLIYRCDREAEAVVLADVEEMVDWISAHLAKISARRLADRAPVLRDPPEA